MELVLTIEAAIVLIHTVWGFPVELASRPRSVLIVALIPMYLACFHPKSMEDVVLEPANVLQVLGFELPLNSLACLCLIVVELAVVV